MYKCIDRFSKPEQKYWAEIQMYKCCKGISWEYFKQITYNKLINNREYDKTMENPSNSVAKRLSNKSFFTKRL